MVTVYKDGAEMQASDNPEGLKILATYGWSTEAPKKPKKVKNDNSD